MGTTREKNMSLSKVKEVQEQYPDYLEKFLDDMFDTESTISQQDWRANMEKKKECNYIIDSERIRVELGYTK